MKLKIALKLALASKLTEEKTRYTTCPNSSGERKSLAIFFLCVTLGFLSLNYPIAEIAINPLI
jgi:hypothetical protein